MITQALILANGIGRIELAPNRSCPLPLVTLLGLPLLKRTVLTAKEAGITRFVIVIREDEQSLRDALNGELSANGVSIEWAMTDCSAKDYVSSVLRAQERLAGPFIVLPADLVCETRMLQALQQLDVASGQMVLCPSDGGETSAGIDVYTPTVFASLAALSAARGPTARADATAFLSQNGSVRHLDVEGLFCKQIETADDLKRAEDAIYRGGGKKTDGLLAHFNKQVVAKPLVKRLLKTPVTPNMVTIVGLLFGLFSGLVFALGGYWFGLLGALLSYLSSLMDHSDGMIARLKFLESPLGAWLESACDFGSYSLIFTGLAIGLYRDSGDSLYLILGALFLLGLIVTFAVDAYQRKRVAGARPQDYIVKWREKIDANLSNPIYWFSRYGHGFGRRSTLPFGILLFALLDQRAFLLGVSAFGAHLYWILTLYSNRLFRSQEPTGG